MRKAIVILVWICGQAIGQSLPDDLNQLDPSILNQHILQRVNALRNEAGAAPLNIADNLEAAAKDHALYITKKNTLSHLQNTRGKKDPWDRVWYYGGNYQAVGENIQLIHPESPTKLKGERKAVPTTTYERLAEVLVTNWFHSKPHYRNMVDPGFENTYTAISYDPKSGNLYAAQVFGSHHYTPPKDVKNHDRKVKLHHDRKCQKCEKDLPLGKTSRTGVFVKGDSIYFYSDHVRQFRKTIRGRRDAIVASIVLKSQFPCNGTNNVNGNPGFTGFALEPVFKPSKRKTNLVKRKDGLLVFLGSVPVSVNKDFEANLTLIKKKRACKEISYYHLDNAFWDQLDLDLQKSMAVPPTHFKIIDSTTSRVNFSLSGTEGDLAELQKMRLAFDASKKIITKAKIEAWASIEGPLENNLRLQSERAERIVEILGKGQEDSLSAEIFTGENFHDFYEDIKGTPYDHLKDLDSLSLKDTINNNQDLRQKLEPFLKDHRYARLKLYTTRYDSIIYTLPGTIGYFNYYVHEKKIGEATRMQTKLFEYVKNGELSLKQLLNIRISQIPQNLSLINNVLVLRHEIDTSFTADQMIAAYDTLRAIDEKNKRINTNQAILLYRKYTQHIYVNSRNEVVDPLENIESIKPIDRQVSGRLDVNSTLYNIAVNYILKRDVQVDKQLKELKKAIRKVKASDEEAFRVARVFCFHLCFKEALDLMKKFKLNDSRDYEHQLFCTKLLLHMRDDIKEKELLARFKEFAELSPKKFCDSFNSPMINFQVLDNPAIKSIYCETCAE